MADGKNIEIKIAATGGEQAASEIKKLETAIGIVDKSEKELAKNRAMFMTAAEAEVAEVERLVTSSKKLTIAKNDLAEATNKVTKQTVTMKTDWKNVGYQVQDVAVQVGAGTSAFRALGQQLPQLLSGFGPVGITLGTVAAVALPLAGAMFALGDATKDAGDKADEAEGKWKKLNDARTAKAVAAGLADNKAYLESIDDEFKALTKNNEAIQRSIDLLQAKHRAKVEVDSAKAALELAKIDASDMTDAEKIKARAKVNEGVEREKFKDAKTEANFRVNAANNAARGASGAADDEAGKLEKERQRLADQEAEKAGLKGRIDAADQAKASLPGVEEQARKAREELLGAKRAGEFGSGAARYSPEQIAELERKVAEADRNKSEVQNAANGATDEDRKRFSTLSEKVLPDTKKAVEDLTVSAEKLAEAAAKAKLDAEKVTAAETIGRQGKFEATQARLETSKIKSDSGAVTAVKKDAKEFLDGQEKSATKADSENNKRDAEAGREGRAAEGLLPKGVSAQFRKAVQKVSDNLQDGDQGGELQKLLGLMENLAAAVEKKGDKSLARRIDILEQRIRNNGK